MKNYEEKLDELIKLKKTKKSLSKKEKAEFEEAWLSCAKAEGFSDNTEKYLYNGFVYCGTKPYKKYLLSVKDPQNELQKLFCGKLFGDNCASTAPLLIHLLCLLINDKRQQNSLIISVIQQLPSALTNKKNKVYGKAGIAVKKYLLDELHLNASLPNFSLLIDEGLTPFSKNHFCSVMNQIITEIDSQNISIKCRKNMQRILKWINQENSTSDEVDIKIQNIDNPHQNFLEPSVDSIPFPSAPVDIKEDISVPAEEEGAFGTEIEWRLSQKKITDLTDELHQLIHDRDDKQKQIAELALCISEQSVEIESLQKEKEKDTESIRDLKEKLDNCNTVIEMLRRDRLKQTEEVSHRIASKLRTYYEDYYEALALEMSIELGENLRDQMGEIFKILIDSGVAIK